MQVHHVGYAVKDIQKAIKEFEELGYEKKSYVEDKERNVFIAFMKNGEEVVELIAPVINGMKTALGDILKKKGPGPYHICYCVDDLEKTIQEMQKNKYIIVVPPQEACAIGGKKVTFMWNKTLGLIELVER